MSSQLKFWQYFGAALCLALISSGCKTVTSAKLLSTPLLDLQARAVGKKSSDLQLSEEGSQAEQAYYKGAKAGTDLEKLDHFLEAARLSQGEAVRSGHSPDARIVYNAACAEIAVLCHRLGRLQESHSIGGASRYPQVRIVDRHAKNFLREEEILAADRLSIGRLKNEVKVKGVGGTLVSYSPKESELYADDPNVVWEGRVSALTATVSFPSKGRASVEIHDPNLETPVFLAGRRVKLAADYSTPLGYLGSFSARGDVGLRALFKPTDNERVRTLTMLESYKSDQIPVVLIHGLMSTPSVWTDVYLSCIEDERLRKNFQFLAYRYPTGYGIGLNGREFRDSYRAFVAKYEPSGRNPAINQTVLVGHSMGGLLTSLSIRSSGNTVWDQVAERRPEELDLDPEVLNDLKSKTFFEPLSEVSRAVFMATPHRGSDIATGFAGKLGVSLIKIPTKVLGSVAGVATGDLRGFNELGLDIISHKTTSIDHLEPNAWELETLLDLPISSRTRTHSIIGMEKEKPLEESTDGVVPYWSSHLDGVESELVVESDHYVPEVPEGIEELKRILHLHLDELGR